MRILLLYGLVLASCCGASLQVDSLLRGQVKVSLRESAGAYFLEKSTDLRTFTPVSIFSNAIILPAVDNFSAFRVEPVSEVALSYFQRTRPTAAAQIALNQWLTDLGEMGILSNVVYMASFQTDYVGGFRSSIPAIVGSDAVPNKPITFANGGVAFDGSLFLTFTNPLPASVSELSVLAAFQSEPAPSFGLVLGNDAGEGRAGPAMWTGGDPYLFVDTENLSFTCSADGKVDKQPGFRAASTFNWGNQSVPELALGSVSSKKVTMQVEIDREYSIPLTNSYPVANPGKEWRIGQRLNGALPYKGKLFFVAVFNKQLGSNDLVKLRERYLRSIGKSVAFPTTQLIIEGDSLSEEAFNTEYGHWLHNASDWKGKFVKRNIARFGKTTIQMLEEFKGAVPEPAGEKNYLFIWGGRNDLGFSTGMEIFARLRTYWKRSRDLGYKVGAFTILPAAYEKTTGIAIAEQREELNRLIRGASAEYDILFDVDAIPELQNPVNPTYFKNDGVHVTAEASKLISNLINATLKP